MPARRASIGERTGGRADTGGVLFRFDWIQRIVVVRTGDPDKVATNRHTHRFPLSFVEAALIGPLALSRDPHAEGDWCNTICSVDSAVSFSVGSATSIAQTYSGDSALPLLAGPAFVTSKVFAWGLPFFYGRNVYAAIEQQSTPGGKGPYVAY